MSNQKRLSAGLIAKLALASGLTLVATAATHADVTNPVIGNLIFEENFDTLNSDRWNVIEGDGCQYGPNLCGWGNQELQYYQDSNVTIEDVPGEPGNKAVVFEARNETVNGSAFTSGKIDSEDGIAIKYGMIEFRLRVPNMGVGYWPAVWMLGTSTESWPSKGEIDMMEMGHRAQGMADAGHPGTNLNNYTAANAIFYAEAACVPENPTCAAMTAWQTDNAYVSQTSMGERFVIYRTYWTDTQLRFTVIDNGVEYDMYDEPITIGEEASELQQPFYLLANLAVGGNFTDASTPAEVTAQLPGKMYLDYIRVYQLDGMGEIFEGSIAKKEYGTFGVFTDDTPTSNKLVAGDTSQIYIWNQNSLSEGTLAPAEGDNVIAWNYTAPEWFGAGIQAVHARDMSNFENGEFKFKIKIPANVSFKVGFADTYTNENWLTFPANQTTYGLVRNGEWAEATIPVADLRGSLIALQSMAGMFYIASVDGQIPTSNFEFAIDDIRWEGGGAGPVDSDGDGVADELDQCPGTPAGTAVDSVGCQIGIPQPVAVTVEAEDYQTYYDTTGGNSGNAYRSDDVDIEAASEGGFNVGWTDAGEWMDYTLNLAAGTYDVTARVASNTDTGVYSVSLDGTTIGSNSVATGGWQNWVTQVVGQITVNGGQQTLRISSDAAGYNINWVHFEPVPDTDNDGVPDSQDNCPNTPAGTEVDANGCAIVVDPVPVHIEAEDYVAYHDLSAGNNGGQYRSDDVDIEAASEGGFNVGWTDTGEWLEYSVELIEGVYDLTARVASLSGNGAYSVSISGQSVGGSNSVATGGWQNWETQHVARFVAGTGTYTIRVNADAGGFNLNWLHIEPVNDPDSDNDGVPDSQDNCANTPAGTEVDASGCPVVVQPFGVTQSDSNSAQFYVNGADWAVLHYSVNGGGQVNVSMSLENGKHVYTVPDLAPGDSISYFVTYWDPELGGARDSETVSYSVVAAGSDSDGDGVGDSADQCPNTPAGTAVDSVGCPVTQPPSDSDNDGVTDANDQCPNTPAGTSVDSVGCPVVQPPSDSDNDGVVDSSDQCPNTPAGTSVNAVGCPVTQTNIVPLYNASTNLEGAISFDRGDALVTRISDRGRDRHAKENHFQAYDHYLTFYWEDRTIAIEIVDYVAKGGSSIRMNIVSQMRLDDTEAENRWFYIGNNTLAEYCGNGVMNEVDHTHYWKESSFNCREGRPIQIGDKMEFEISQFLDPALLPRGRSNYYGTTYLYIVGEGLVPWDVTDKVAFQGGNRLQRDSIPVPEHARLGGDTTLHVQMTAEPDGHFQQMATNLGFDNGQPFVLGRRVHHTSYIDGTHDESAENGVFDGMPGKAGPHYVNDRCSDCHERNGRAPVAGIGEPLDRWVFKVGDANGNPHPDMGRVLQPEANNGAASEGTPTIAFFSEENGLRKPNYAFSGITPDTFSARIAPQLNGIGLLEAIPESAILAQEDVNDADGDGISGKAQRSIDPVTGETRLGRFGYKAATSSVKHQVAAAFNTDIGVRTSVMPNPDCGSNQNDCGPSGAELADEHLDNLVKYVSLLGVRPQRDYNDAQVLQGKQVFNNVGCASCHTDTYQTSQYHPLAELRSQTIHPYTDLLLHDMGPELADNLGEGDATGAEWRTAPLWGLGLSACVTGGVEGGRGWDDFGLDGYETCTPHHSYLHDGRARTIEEAILWHGGEGENSKQAYQNLSNSERDALLAFLNSL